MDETERADCNAKAGSESEEELASDSDFSGGAAGNSEFYAWVNRLEVTKSTEPQRHKVGQGRRAATAIVICV